MSDHEWASRCPVHNQPDCSPLLNGCSVVNRQMELKAERDAARADAQSLREQIRALADTLNSWADQWQTTEVVEESRRDLAADLLSKASQGVAALLGEEA